MPKPAKPASGFDFGAVSARVIDERRATIRRRKCSACGDAELARSIRETLEAWADGRITRPFTWPDFALVVQEVYRDAKQDPKARTPFSDPAHSLFKHCTAHEPEELVNAARR